MRRCAKRKSIPRSIPAGDAVTMKFFRGRSSIPACRASLCSEKTSALTRPARRSEEHTSELQSRSDLVCRLLLEKKKNNADDTSTASGQKLAKFCLHSPCTTRIAEAYSDAFASYDRRIYSEYLGRLHGGQRADDR